MIFIWALAGISSILLDIITVHFFSIYFTFGAMFAMLATYTGYSVPAQFLLFIYMSVCVHVIVFPVLNNKKKKLEGFARKEALQNHILSECLRNIV